jgi:hypothetical protein
MRRAFALVAAIASSSLVSCASYFTRQECNKTDWFQYGRSVAMKGERLTGNDFIHRCEQAEADVDAVALDRGFKVGMETYCKPETVYQMGKQGEFYNGEMCDGEQPRLLKQKHAEGVAEYCKKANGYSAGTGGKAYNGICPKNLEADFLPEFKRGRKVYLTGVIDLNEKEIRQLNDDIQSLQIRKLSVQNEILSLTNASKRTTITYVNGVQTLSTVEDESVKNRKQNLQWDADRLQGEINDKQSKQEQLRTKNRDMQKELIGL